MKNINFKINKEEPIYTQIYHTLAENMKQGYIQYGDKLPSIREIAKQLDVSKSTVENAYDRLLSEGYITSRPKAGYYCDMPEMKHNQKTIPVFSPNTTQKNYLYDFSSRSMDYSQFDQKVWIRYTKEVLENGTLMAGYGESQGELALREQLANHLYHHRGLHAKANQLYIGAGIGPLLYLICSLFKESTLKVGFLKPGFIQAMHIFEDCHHDVVLLDSLEDVKSADIQFLYLTPAHLNLNMKDRLNLLKILKEKNIYLIEDDINGDMYFQSSSIPCMQGLYDEDLVFYLSSFSKLLLPSVRIAVLCMPHSFTTSLTHYNQTASRIEQQVLALYLQDGHMQRRIKRLKRSYLKKAQKMMTLLKDHFEKIHLEEASLYIEIQDNFKNLETDDIINFQKVNDSVIRLHFSAISEDKIEEGIIYLMHKLKK